MTSNNQMNSEILRDYNIDSSYINNIPIRAIITQSEVNVEFVLKQMKNLIQNGLKLKNLNQLEKSDLKNLLYTSRELSYILENLY